jgi:prophage tail gpP-like protein
MAARDSTLTITVGGQKFGGWLSARVSRGIERAAGDFEIACTQRWPGQDARFEIPEGASCTVAIGADKVLTGYVDAVEIRRDAESSTCTISGRSKTADLVDCSPDYTEAELAGQDLVSIATKVAAPFGVTVKAPDGGGATFPVAAAHHGETAWKLIERLARQRKLLVLDDADGNLVLAQLAATASHDALVHPSDGLLSIGTKRDSSKRFSLYTVKAQAGIRWAGAGGGPDRQTSESLALVSGQFADPGVTRYRPRTIENEGAAKKEGALARAEWECRRNIGQALRITASRVGWRQSNGDLWLPNLLVPVRIPAANVDARLALSEVHWRKDEGGTIVELELAPPEAFTPEPEETAAPTGEGARWNDVLQE